MVHPRFLARFRIPPSGLIGPPSLVSFVSQVALEYSAFFDAFNDGLKSFWFATSNGLLAPEKVGVGTGDTLSMTVYEISHRGERGALRDALYLQFTGQKAGSPGKGIPLKIPPIESYVSDGYFPGCWLNPRLNQQQVIVADNPCRTEEEEDH